VGGTPCHFAEEGGHQGAPPLLFPTGSASKGHGLRSTSRGLVSDAQTGGGSRWSVAADSGILVPRSGSLSDGGVNQPSTSVDTPFNNDGLPRN
jgi:hypothetical protein